MKTKPFDFLSSAKSMMQIQNKDSLWIERFDPNKRLLVGNSYLAAKRLFDVALVLLSSPFWIPLILATTLLIWFSSPGAPVFYIQQRTGRGGRRFQMLKFRTMIPNADALVGKLAKINSNGELAGPLKMENDPRVTRVGRILRKTSLDELPQVINVLRGEMSLVGPRPTSWGPRSYKLWQTERLDVTPGITGLWQIYGRGGEDFDEWLRWDISYIEKRSMWLDILILINTFTRLFRQKGAR
jgi:lipopolysaccharide/colanic/teichoic acid biosynthesis glycosyltransferase